MELQRFAEGAEGVESAPETESQETTENQEVESQNKPEIDIDKKISKAIAKAHKEWEAAQKKREAAAAKKAELSKLSEEERQKAEIEQSRKELEIKEKELQRKELMLEMTKVLEERKISIKFIDYLIAEDSESTLERIKTFEKEYKAAVEAGVNEKLKGKIPPAGGKTVNTAGAKTGFLDAILRNQVKRN